MKLTRRQLPGILAASAPVLAQVPAVKPENPAEELKAAAERLQRTAAAIRGFSVPMATEPAFSFRAQDNG